MHYRAYDPQKDKDNVHRIWFETGWLEKGKEEIMDTLVAASKAIVADINGEPECLVLTAPGTLRYLGETLSMCAVTAVTTSRIARRQGFAKRLTAQAIATDAADGMLTAGLGMFEQGFYNQIGFGTGDYEHWVAFDPAELQVRRTARAPRRLKVEDAEIIHKARLARTQGHGASSLLPWELTKGDLMWRTNGFGLGYFDGPNGELTHCLWAGTKDVEQGPYEIHCLAYQTGAQFLELMALLKNLGDQVHMVKMQEPPTILLQDLIMQPFKQRTMTQNSPFAAGTRAAAYWRRRICDLRGCLERTHLPGDSVRFNLKLSDPIADALDDTAPWRGVGGDYVVTLGPSSGADKGVDAALATLTASVGAFTRLWLGVRPASGLAITDDLAAPPELIERLDDVLRLPPPRPDWDF